MRPIKTIKDTNRIAKVNSHIEHELGPILLEHLQGTQGLVTISKVETTKDMKEAKIWISIFSGKQLQTNIKKKDLVKQDEPVLSVTKGGRKEITPVDKKILSYLNAHLYEIQGALNKRFATRVIPRIRFELDTAPRYAQLMDELIRKSHSEE